MLNFVILFLLKTLFSVDNIRPPKQQHKRNAYGEKVKTARMDLMFLILFPCIFFIFNIVYWVGFLYVVPKSTDGLGEKINTLFE